MAIVFPSTPATGDVFNKWEWDGNHWVKLTGIISPEEAPSDGVTYGRVDEDWEPVVRTDGSTPITGAQVINGRLEAGSTVAAGQVGLEVARNLLIQGAAIFHSDVTLAHDPAQDTEAATKHYVDSTALTRGVPGTYTQGTDFDNGTITLQQWLDANVNNHFFDAGVILDIHAADTTSDVTFVNILGSGYIRLNVSRQLADTLRIQNVSAVQLSVDAPLFCNAMNASHVNYLYFGGRVVITNNFGASNTFRIITGYGSSLGPLAPPGVADDFIVGGAVNLYAANMRTMGNNEVTGHINVSDASIFTITAGSLICGSIGGFGIIIDATAGNLRSQIPGAVMARHYDMAASQLLTTSFGSLASFITSLRDVEFTLVVGPVASEWSDLPPLAYSLPPANSLFIKYQSVLSPIGGVVNVSMNHSGVAGLEGPHQFLRGITTGGNWSIPNWREFMTEIAA